MKIKPIPSKNKHPMLETEDSVIINVIKCDMNRGIPSQISSWFFSPGNKFIKYISFHSKKKLSLYDH